MSWKKAVFFGGALLVLAACGDATAPSPSALSRVGGNSAALMASLTPTTDTTTTSTTNPIVCSGIVIHVGLDGSLITDCDTLE